MSTKKSYYEKNKKDILERAKKKYELNRVEQNKKTLEYYYANRDKWKTYHERYQKMKRPKVIYEDEDIKVLMVRKTKKGIPDPKKAKKSINKCIGEKKNNPDKLLVEEDVILDFS